MRKFNTKSNKISINGNVIKRIAERDGTCDLIVSSNFYVATDNKKYKDPTNPNQLIPADIRYYEIQVNTFCIISMGIIDTHQYGYSPNNQIGWRPYSIGFHSDDGALFRKGYSTISRYGKAYGSIVGETNVVGCGYNKRKQTVFFTVNGKKLEELSCNWNIISAAIATKEFDEIIVNYGDSPFVFNLQKEIQSTLNA